jgi:hypothetical protein
MTSTKWTLCAVEGSLPPTPHRRPGKAFPPRPPRKTFGERSAFQRCEQPHPHHNPCHSDARAQRDRRNLLLTFACATPPASSRAQPFFRRSEGSPANPHRARVRRTLLPPAFALLCHPERSITSTKWTSCAVEGSLTPAHHCRPSKAFPPRMQLKAFGCAASNAANNPTPTTNPCHSDARAQRDRRNLLLTRACATPPASSRAQPFFRRSEGSPANPHRARVRRTLLPPAFALLCHPERSMTPTKWTSCAVEGSLPPTPHRRPSKAFPPRMRRYGPLGGAASSAANNPTPTTTLVIPTRERSETGGTCC